MDRMQAERGRGFYGCKQSAPGIKLVIGEESRTKVLSMSMFLPRRQKKDKKLVKE